MLPLKKGIRIYVKNIDAAKAEKFGTVVDKPEQADIAIVRLQTPSEVLPNSGILGKLMRARDNLVASGMTNQLFEMSNIVESQLTENHI